MDIKVETPGNEVYEYLNAQLVRANHESSSWSNDAFTVALRDENGALIGGVRGITNMGLVEVRGLWIDPPHRGGGTGTHLMALLEAHALSLGATRAALYTYEWQARSFYEKLGYIVYGTLDFPAGAKRYYMQKDLKAPD